jgi:hypothetical protein
MKEMKIYIWILISKFVLTPPISSGEVSDFEAEG